MKVKSAKACAVVAALMFGTTASMAQSVRTVDEPYQAELPIAPAKVAPIAAVPAAPAGGFDVTATDKTIREVLARWSSGAGWTHGTEHWTINRDLPIAGMADASVFGTDFKEAVRKLLASSEFTDRPVQPCFYSNKIVRVVPKAELCDKASQSVE